MKSGPVFGEHYSLLGDDIAALSQNTLVFPNLSFDKKKDFDCPPGNRGCPPHDKIVRPRYLGPMHTFFCTTGFEGSNISNLNDQPGRWILSSHPKIGYVPERMWHSSKANKAGWISFEVTFPLFVSLNRLIVYTEHSGKYNKSEKIQIEYEMGNGAFSVIKRVSTPNRDSEVIFKTKKARKWKFAFKAGKSGYVVVRGIRFFHGDDELFPPLGPHAITDYGETHVSKVSNLVEIQRVIRASSSTVKFDSRSMWHSGKVNSLGWVSIEVTFPTKVKLDKLKVYSEHSGKYHRAKQVQIEASNSKGQFKPIKNTTLSKPTASISFSPKTAKTWKFAFQGKKGGYVVIRGLRFFIGNEEFYPPSKVD